jgi:two-component system, NarL family, sensor kinase
MKKFFLLFCFLFSIAICTKATKQSVQDSLVNLLNTQSTTTERKLLLYDELLMQLTRSDKNLMEEYTQEAIAFAQKNKNKKYESSYRISYGMSLYFKGMMDRTLQEYLAALKLAEEINDKKLMSRVMHEMGVFYNKNGMRDKGIKTIEQSVEYARTINDTDGVARSLNSLGALYEQNNELDKALICYKESLEKYTLLKSDLGSSYSYSNIGLVYLYKSDFINAKQNLEASLNLRLKLNDVNAIAMSYIDLAELYKAQQNYSLAIEQANLCINYAEKVSYKDIIQYSYNLIAQCYAALKQYDKAYEYKQLHQNLKDSLFNLKKSEQIADMQTKYDTDKKEQQIKIQALEITKRNTYLVVSILIFLALLVVLYLMYNRYKLNQANKLQSEIIKQQDLASRAIIEAEENERKRIAGDLHDGIGQLFSAVKMNLSGLTDRITMQDEDTKLLYDKTIAMVDESCSEVRSISHNMMPNVLLKYGLATAIRDFISKIDSRKLKVFLELEGINVSLDSSVETVLYRVIQESVNNVIKHSNASRLDIQINKDEDGISVSIEDNGKGFDTTKAEKFEGIGLKNIITRVQLIKGFVEWDSSPDNGTLVSIFIPNTNINPNGLPS